VGGGGVGKVVQKEKCKAPEVKVPRKDQTQQLSKGRFYELFGVRKKGGGVKRESWKGLGQKEKDL